MPRPPAQHGTRSKYTWGKCRCDLCKAANARYYWDRYQIKRESGETNPLVSARRAREHLRRLRRAGMGRDAVAAATDLAAHTVQEIATGKRRRITLFTERLLLAVTDNLQLDGAMIPSAETKRLLRELLEEGYSEKEIAKHLGYRGRAVPLLRRDKITVRNAARVRRLHHRLTA